MFAMDCGRCIEQAAQLVVASVKEVDVGPGGYEFEAPTIGGMPCWTTGEKTGGAFVDSGG